MSETFNAPLHLLYKAKARLLQNCFKIIYQTEKDAKAFLLFNMCLLNFSMNGLLAFKVVIKV